jgi:2-polyprenyl-3-methyl-5-hydroxy-6-metoxy-1,4-benzoquinol methylase
MLDDSNIPGPRNLIDSPRPNEKVYDQCISIAGSLCLDKSSIGSQCVCASIDGVCIGQTKILTPRDAETSRYSYRILGRMVEPITSARRAVIVLTLSDNEHGIAEPIGELTSELVPARLAEQHYGEVLPPNREEVLHRENIYGSGPPLEQVSPALIQMILGYLAPGRSVVDVGCGAGVFAPSLTAAGHNWLGLEISDYCLQLLAQRSLPHRKLSSSPAQFPCGDGEFDDALCIEVLEHVAQPDEFLGEITRIIRNRALFSVPNMEVIPYLSSWHVVPWHLLEGTHKNFFTRTSLLRLLTRHFASVEVFSYGKHPLRTRDEIPLHQHLFAVADT